MACTSLRRLELPNCGVDDAMLQKLSKLNNLESLNLTGDPVSAAGVQHLLPLKGLQQLYLYQTELTGVEMDRLQQQWPSVRIDTGGYRLPMLPGDTSEVKVN